MGSRAGHEWDPGSGGDRQALRLNHDPHSSARVAIDPVSGRVGRREVPRPATHLRRALCEGRDAARRTPTTPRARDDHDDDAVRGLPTTRGQRPLRSCPFRHGLGRSQRPNTPPNTPLSRPRLGLSLDEVRGPRNLYRVLDALSSRTLAHVSLQSPRDLALKGICGQTQRVVHMDFREQDDPVHDFVGAFRCTADGVVRYLNPTHLQCAVKSPE